MIANAKTETKIFTVVYLNMNTGQFRNFIVTGDSLESVVESENRIVEFTKRTNPETHLLSVTAN